MVGLTVGMEVRTPFGTGTVREIRGTARIVVDVRGRALVLRAADVTPAPPPPARRRARPDGSAARPDTPAAAPATIPEIDLHGLTVDEALARVDEALDAACLADRPSLRLIHGRRGGRIRAALHGHLARITAVRAWRLDPHNPGVTIVDL